MSTPNCSPHRDVILRHFLTGSPLGPEARQHYAGCVHCMAATTAALTRNGTPGPPGQDGAAGLNGSAAGAAPAPEPARRALDHGRHVLEREFGIRPDTGLGRR